MLLGLIVSTATASLGSEGRPAGACVAFDTFVEHLIRDHTNGYGDLGSPSRWTPAIAKAREAGCYEDRPEGSTWVSTLLQWAEAARSSTSAPELEDSRRADFAVELICGVHARWAESQMVWTIHQRADDSLRDHVETCLDALSEMDGESWQEVERFFGDPERLDRLDYDEWLAAKPSLQPLFVRALREAHASRRSYRDALYADLCSERADDFEATSEVDAVCGELQPHQAQVWDGEEATERGLRSALWVALFAGVCLGVRPLRSSVFTLWVSWLGVGVLGGLVVALVLPLHGSEAEAILSAVTNLVGSFVVVLGTAIAVAVRSAGLAAGARARSTGVALLLLALAAFLLPIVRLRAGG